jgi:hypothetical protein
MSVETDRVWMHQLETGTGFASAKLSGVRPAALALLASVWRTLVEENHDFPKLS